MATKRQRKKKRQRAAERSPAPPQVATAPQEVPQRRDPKGPPPPPWGSFPLSELVILVAIVLLFAGFFVPPPRGGVMIGVGLVLGSLAGLELAVREHFAGYKSHTLLLGGAAGVAVVGGLFALGPDSLPLAACVGIGAVAFAAASYGFALVFRRRSGGALFRFRA